MAALLPFGKAPYGKSNNAQPNKTFITTAAFNTQLFNYSTSFNPATYTTTGSLVVNPEATSGNCPAGRVLHANGKFLKSGVHPNLTNGPNTYTFLLGVYDPISFLNGYIDPSSSTFAPYDANMPYFDDSGLTQPALGGAQGKALFGPKFVASGSESATVEAGNAVVGQVILGDGNVAVNSTAVNSGSIILLTLQSTDNTANLSVGTVNNGNFTILSALDGATYPITVNFLVIN